MINQKARLRAKCEIFDEAGRVLLEKGKTYKLREIVIREAFYGKRSETYYPAEITGYKLHDVAGTWSIENFETLED